MSSGPIKAAREAFGKREPVTTPEVHRLCAQGEPGRGYCGRKRPPAKITEHWPLVVCAECWAARRADEAVK